jgi:2-C-methyl-D-erythritol 2,4-cyclodiphosphate synthase
MIVRTGLGQDSHAFEEPPTGKRLLLGGVHFEGEGGLAGNSDADVVLHAVTNAVSGVTGVDVLGAVSDAMCRDQGITDSAAYLAKALESLGPLRITHVSISIECRRPRIAPRIGEMREAIARMAGLTPRDVGITATSGEGLTSFGRGHGIQALAVVTAVQE